MSAYVPTQNVNRKNDDGDNQQQVHQTTADLQAETQ